MPKEMLKRRSVNCLRNESGFSLLEVVIIVAIIGIISMIAIPNMISWRGERQLDGVARNFMADMQLAKMSAVREGIPVAVVMTTGAGTGEVFAEMFVDSNLDYVRGADEKLLRSSVFPRGISFVKTTFSGDRTRFSSKGVPNIIGRAIFENTAGTNSEVVLNRIGRLRIQ